MIRAVSMLVQCKQCGAPLDVAGTVTHAKCTYCDTVNKVRSMQTISPSTPAGWTPPPQWQPPPQYYQPPRPLAYHQVPVMPVRRQGSAAVVMAIVIVVVTGALGLVPFLLARGGGGFGSLPFVPAWDGTTPFRCGGNDSVTIENVNANLTGSTAMTIEANCEVEIVGSTIVANQGIYADGNRRVTIRNSTILTTGTGIVAGGNKEIVLINSTVTAAAVAIQASGNVEVDINGGTVTGNPRAWTTESNAEVRNAGAQVVDRGALFGVPVTP